VALKITQTVSGELVLNLLGIKYKEWVETCNKATMSDPHELIDMSFEEMSEMLYNILLKITKEHKEQIQTLESMTR